MSDTQKFGTKLATPQFNGTLSLNAEQVEQAVKEYVARNVSSSVTVKAVKLTVGMGCEGYGPNERSTPMFQNAEVTLELAKDPNAGCVVQR